MALRYWLIVIGLGCIFGSSFAGVEYALREAGPFTIGAARSLFAAMACWAYLLISGRKIPRDADVLWKLMLLGVFSYAFGNVFGPMAQQHISSGLAAVFTVTMPVLTVLVSHFWPGGERATPNKAAGVVVGFLGASLLFMPALMTGGASGELWAMMIALAPSIIFAFVFNINRQFAGIDPVVMATFALTGAAMVVVPVGVAVEGLPQFQSWTTWLVLVLMGVFPGAFNFIVMYHLLPIIGPTNYSINTYITPTVALILGVVLFGELIHPLQLTGMLVIFCALLLIDGRLLKRLRRKPVVEATPAE